MFNDTETQRSLARQREREHIEEANRDRLARAARERGRGADTRRRDGR